MDSSILQQISGLKSDTQSITWRSPSNIAIVKYWGKHGRQLPRNTSISFTLDEAHTDTKMSFEAKPNDGEVTVDFLFEGQANEAFSDKIVRFFGSLTDEFSFLHDYHFRIESSNSFPHSSGIASSASAMSALAMGLCSIEKILTGWPSTEEDFLKKASHIARLGSGSAARSVYPKVAIWGHHDAVAGSSDTEAIAMTGVHAAFDHFHDDILIVSADEKSVSSTAGHALMETNRFAATRYAQAQDNILETINALQTGDILKFGKILEEEAMTLHALMMCSDPSYMLMRPGTISVIEKVRAYRAETMMPLYFTLDAGPNVHLLYPDELAQPINQFIESELKPYCHNGRIIKDQVGMGPKLLS